MYQNIQGYAGFYEFTSEMKSSGVWHLRFSNFSIFNQYLLASEKVTENDGNFWNEINYFYLFQLRSCNNRGHLIRPCCFKYSARVWLKSLSLNIVCVLHSGCYRHLVITSLNQSLFVLFVRNFFNGFQASHNKTVFLLPSSFF